MKKTAKVLAIVLAAVMLALCFAGCGKKESDKNTIKIGGIGPLTGDYANYGTSNNNGAKIAVEEINANGGIAGMQIDLDFQDSAADPESAVNAYGKLIDNGMDISLGATFSGETASVVAAAREDNILVLTPTGSADVCIEGNDCAFRVCFKDSEQGILSANVIKDYGLPTDVAVFYQSDIDYSVGLYESFTAECQNKGINIVEVQTFTLGTNTDFSTQINAIKDSGVKLVFIPIYAADASTFLTQAQGKLDEDILYFGCDGLDGILGKVSDPSIAENVMMLTPFAADDPVENVQSFVKKYNEKYGANPDQFAADGYDAIYVIKAAVEKAGVKPGDPDFDEKVIAAMLEIEVTGVTGTMTWAADGNTIKAAKAMIIHDGVAVLYQG